MAYRLSYFYKPNRLLAGVLSAQSAIISVAFAQSSTTANTAVTLPTVVITESRSAGARADVTGFGEAPLREAPLSATVIDQRDVQSSGAQRLADVYKFDASVSDAYNAVGYVDYATVRGFVIDNKYNYRREGLPISAETAIGLDNKARVEILKGTSGIQAGTSAPGGLVNYVVKRPTANDLRSAALRINTNGAVGAAVDLGGRLGDGKALGYRINLSADRLRDAAPRTRGRRELLALALDTRLGRDSLLEAELEYSRQSQPNVPGLSVLGSSGALPAPDAKINLNQQTWSQPTVFSGITGSVRFEHAINTQWRFSAQAGAQRLKTDDRVAFPYGCGNAGSGSCNAFYDNGDYDLYDFRSEGERRRTQAAQLKLQGSTQLAGMTHELSFGLLHSAARDAIAPSAYNYVGTGNLSSNTSFAPDPSLTQDGNTRRERSLELSATDVTHITPSFKTWLGLRHTQLQRESSKSGTRYTQRFSTPWLAATYAITPATTLYASWGQGIESRVVPNLPAYGAQAGQPLPAQRSRQTELGIKGGNAQQSASLAYFDIRKPLVNDDGSALTPDGQQQHRGFEAQAQQQWGALSVGGAVTLLNARQIKATQNVALNGLRPTNVPSYIARLNAGYQFATHWQLGAHVSREGPRAVLPDNSIRLPAWTRLDATLRYDTQASEGSSQSRGLSFLLGVDNLLNKRYYKESPYQFGHAYLFPGAPRTWRASVIFTL
jgi:iron complex outermembrane recepter protein